MLIDPTGPGKTSGSAKQAGPVARANADAPKPRAAGTSEARSDQIEISGAARELSGTERPEASSSSDLAPERLHEVLARIADGFYESDDVQAELLGEIAQTLGLSTQRG